MTQKRLWAPWRLAYIASHGKRRDRRCLFCRQEGRLVGLKNQIVARGRLGYLLLNRFPYTNGHLMAVPYRHVGHLKFLKEEEWLELLKLTNEAVRRLDQALHPDGYNLGLNLGRAAGAGVLGHLHLHIVPRWVGDTNFMPVVADTRVISQSLEEAYRRLKVGRHR